MKTKKYISKHYMAFIVSIALTMFFTVFTYGQSNNLIDFKIRTSDQAPAPFKNAEIYNLRGDFKVLGNAVLFDTSSKPGSNNSNNGSMNFHKLPGDRKDVSIFNSSSADLVAPDSNSLDCTKIVYAGLYWSGRANSSSKMDKGKVKLKLPKSASYVDVTAENSGKEIFKGGVNEENIYVSYVDITGLVREIGTDAFGTFSVANIASSSGNGGGVGYFGGWGLVVIYENPTMPWRDITVFDGFSFVQTGTSESSEGIIELSGFRAVQTGDVKIKMAMMAGEGDQGISGDQFHIQKKTTSSWQELSHTGNSTDNFFNSSIFTGGNPRVPSKSNNYGTDISMFNLNNEGNKLIGNNQTTTKFKYSTTQDTYVIYNIVFAVDAYIPEVVVENNVLSGVTSNGEISPAQQAEFELLLRNKGSDQITNGVVKVNIPSNMHYVDNSATFAQDKVVKGIATWTPPLGTPAGLSPDSVAGGTLTWTFDKNVPFGNATEIYGAMRYKLKATDNCLLLNSTLNNCATQVGIGGDITGMGENSKELVNSRLVSGYLEGSCAAASYDDLRLTIKASSDFLAQCALDFSSQIKRQAYSCSSQGQYVARQDIVKHFPYGTKFYDVLPTQANDDQNLVTQDFPIQVDQRNYYAIIPGFSLDCYIVFSTQLEIITTVPVVIEKSLFCLDQEIVFGHSVSEKGKELGFKLYFFDSNKQLLSNPVFDKNLGEHTYFVAEGKTVDNVDCYSELVAFSYNVVDSPVIKEDISDVVSCQNNDVTIEVIIEGTDQIKWEYSTDFNVNSWSELQSSSIVGQIIKIDGGKLILEHLNNSINGVQLRAVVTNIAGCVVYSSTVSVLVENCGSISNPALPSKALVN